MCRRFGLWFALVCAVLPLAAFSMGSRVNVGQRVPATVHPQPKPSGYGIDDFLRREAEKPESAASRRLSRSGYGIDDLP